MGLEAEASEPGASEDGDDGEAAADVGAGQHAHHAQHVQAQHAQYDQHSQCMDGQVGQGPVGGSPLPADLVGDLRAQENRLSNLIQSLLVAAALGVTPLIRLIPTAVLWGYFAYMALASLPGNDFWERVLLFLRDGKEWRRYRRDKPGLTSHFLASYTVLQLAWLLGVIALVTWAGIAGISFPVPILLLVPVRMLLLPRVLRPQQVTQLQVLDPPDV